MVARVVADTLVVAACPIVWLLPLTRIMFPDCPAVILVKVRVTVPVGVQRKLFVAFMSNEPSLSVVTVPR